MLSCPPSNDNEAILRHEEQSMDGQTIVITLDQPYQCLGAVNACAAANGRQLPRIGAVAMNNQDDSQDERCLVAPTEEVTAKGRHIAVALGTVAQDSSRQECK